MLPRPVMSKPCGFFCKLGWTRIAAARTVRFLVGNGGMDYGDDYWGLYRDYYRDPFAHSPLRTGQRMELAAWRQQSFQQCKVVTRRFCVCWWRLVLTSTCGITTAGLL